jgi:hypothetical protein
MQNKKYMAIPLLVIVALGLVGFAYASWYDHLYVNGQIDTAYLKMKLMSVSSDDPPGTIDVNKDKDVGTTTASKIDDTHVQVTITNGYPCYEVYVHFTIQNVGTIPVHFRGFGPQPPFVFDGKKTWKASLFDGGITVWGWDSNMEQLHPGDNGDYTIWIHIEQPAKQHYTYTFTVEVIYSQWNGE